MSGNDGRAGAAEAGPTSAPTEPFPVAPVLVRDYRRLLRLFPYAYRRAHEAEMLGHLLDGAGPGQSRPSRPERADLLRAAAREWLLAPLGSMPWQRQASTAALATILPVLLAFPMGRSLGSLAGTVIDPARRHLAFEWAPAAPAWTLWAAALALLVGDRARAGRRVGAAGTTLLVGSLVLLGIRGDWHDVSREVGWLAPMIALLVVVREREEAVPLLPRRTLVACAVGGIVLVRALGIVAGTVPVLASSMTLMSMWAIGMAGPLLVMGVLLGGGALLSRIGRQCLPVALGVVTGLWIGRFGLLDMVPLNGPGPGALVPQVLGVLSATAAARWVVNRADELAEARDRSRGVQLGPRPRREGEPTSG